MSSSSITKTTAVQVTGFLTAGSVATAVHWAVMAVLIGWAIEPLAATAAGSVSGAAVNYGLQRRLAFRNAGPHCKALWRYVVSCGLAWTSNLFVFFFLNHVLALQVVNAQVITTLMVSALNFFIYQKLVFHERFL